MTPKEKAEEIVSFFLRWVNDERSSESGSFYDHSLQLDNAKKCSIFFIDGKINFAKTFGKLSVHDIREFEEVKQEINKL